MLAGTGGAIGGELSFGDTSGTGLTGARLDEVLACVTDGVGAILLVHLREL